MKLFGAFIFLCSVVQSAAVSAFVGSPIASICSCFVCLWYQTTFLISHLHCFMYIPPQQNDLCEDAISIGSLPVTVSGKTTTATLDNNAADCTGNGQDGSVTAPGVWYTFCTDDMYGPVTLSSCNEGTNFDTKISVYKGTCDALECVSANDDGDAYFVCYNGYRYQSRLVFFSEPFTKYYVLVHGYDDCVGEFDLTIDGEASMTCPGGEGTPDSVPPAFEAMCDSYTGSAKAHCVSYCEARDCDEVNKPGCDVVRNNFIDETGDDVPCERCPCWTSTEIDSFTPVNPAIACMPLGEYHFYIVDTGASATGDYFGVGNNAFDSHQLHCRTQVGYVRNQILVTQAQYDFCRSQVENKCISL